MKNESSSVVLVFNNKKQLLLQLRAAHDHKYPLHWDFSAAGGIEQGEHPLHAANRELKEELGISGVLQFMKEIQYSDEKGIDRLYIYYLQYNGHFNPDPNEVDSIKFFSENEIDEMISMGEKFHPEFVFLWKDTAAHQKLAEFFSKK